MARFWKWEGYRFGFCKKLLEASSTYDGANAKQIQDGPATGQGQAHQQKWPHHWGKGFKKGQWPVQLWMEPEGDCDSVRHLCWSSLLIGLVSLGGAHIGAACFWGTALHGRDPHWRLWKGPTLEKFMQDCPTPTLAQRKWGVLPCGRNTSRDNVWWTDRSVHSLRETELTILLTSL